jgi:hypothetical protein
VTSERDYRSFGLPQQNRIRMEESDDTTEAYAGLVSGGIEDTGSEDLKKELLYLRQQLTERVMHERASLVESVLDDNQVRPREKRKLLQENRQMFVLAMGGRTSSCLQRL